MATDGGLGERARIGLLVLRTDQTIEHEARIILPQIAGVALYHARIYNDFTINRENLLAMADRMADTARLLPVDWGFRAIAYACTSGSMVIGPKRVEALVQSVHPGVSVTNPVSASLAAFGALAISKIAVVTPYGPEINEAIASGLRAEGIEIPTFVSFEEPDDNKVARITVEALSQAAITAGQGECQGVFIACTSLRTVEAIPEIERRIGKPVTSSNHATLWHLLRLAGVQDRLERFGRLFEVSPANQQKLRASA
jgi:maleate isomerase